MLNALRATIIAAVTAQLRPSNMSGNLGGKLHFQYSCPFTRYLVLMFWTASSDCGCFSKGQSLEKQERSIDWLTLDCSGSFSFMGVWVRSFIFLGSSHVCKAWSCLLAGSH